MTDPQLQLLQDATAKLSEHFDSVRIFCTVHDGSDESTQSFTYGAGNMYAQYGQVHDWIITQDEYVRIKASDDED